MDENSYAEVLVPRKTKGWVIPAMIGTGILAFGSVILALSMQWGWVAIIAVITAIFVGWRYIREEYEYIFITDELNVTTIYSENTRRKGPKVSMSNVEIMERFNEGMLEQIRRNPNAVLEDYSSHMTGEPVYYVKYSDAGKTHYLLLEPTDRLLNAMWRSAPGKVKRA